MKGEIALFEVNILFNRGLGGDKSSPETGALRGIREGDLNHELDPTEEGRVNGSHLEMSEWAR